MSWFTPLSSDSPVGLTVNQSDAVGWAMGRATEPGLSLLLGSAGTGKSTVCNAIAHNYAGRVHIENATFNTSLEDAVNHVRTSLGTPEPGDLVILDDYFDGVSPIYPTELRILAEPTHLGRGHLLVTARNTPHLRSRFDDQLLQFPPAWGDASQSSEQFKLTWTPTDLEQALLHVTAPERVDLLRELLGDPSTPRELLRSAAGYLNGDRGFSDADQRPNVLILPDESGRFRVEPASSVTATTIDAAGTESDNSSAKSWVIHRRGRNLWLPAAADLEDLINDPGIREHDLQQFFEAHPHLLTRDSHVRAIPHPVLARTEGDLIPDFMLEVDSASFADLVELKLPKAQVVAGKKNRVRPAAELTSALAQVREYQAHFEDSGNRRQFSDTYGVDAYRPAAVIIIGRDAPGGDPLELRRLWNDLPGNTTVHTYDDLLRRIRRLGSY